MTGWRPHIESALCLSLPAMFSAGSLAPNAITLAGTWAWWRDKERVAAIGYSSRLSATEGTLTLDYVANGNPVHSELRLSTVPNHFGGRNWYVHCPSTGRRARKLYKWPPLAEFCHRNAVRPLPTYACQRAGGTDRILSQRWALRRRMGDQWSDLFGEPCRPKWMRWKTFERFAARDAELEAREAPSWAHLLGLTGVDL